MHCLLPIVSVFCHGRGSGDKGKKALAHIKSRQHRARGLRTLQDVVSGELGAEYPVKHVPDKAQIVLTPVDGGGEWCSAHRTIHAGEDLRCGASGYLYRCRPVEPAHIQQPGNPRLHWMPLAADGTSRHEASYVHCTLGGTSSPDQLASWWLLGSSEEWVTLYAAAQEVDFDQQL